MPGTRPVARRGADRSGGRRYAAPMRPTAAEIVATLGLEPHPEGGYYRETYRAPACVETARGARAAATAILFLVTVAEPSRLHRLAGDELWVYQGGLPLELVRLSVFGETSVLLGDPAGGAAAARQPQALVHAGVWQGARVAGARRSAAERAWSLVTCVVTPGFDPADFELGRRDELRRLFPEQRALVDALT